jgi:hypothetical protein
MSDEYRPPTPAELEAIRTRDKNATPGPWFRHGNSIRPNRRPDSLIATLHGSSSNCVYDGAFIIYARTDIPQLLAERDEMEGIIADLQQDSVAYRLGEREAYAKVLNLLRTLRGEAMREENDPDNNWDDKSRALGRVQMTNMSIDAVLELAGLKSGQTFTHIPPEQAREEAKKMRGALKELLSATRTCTTGYTVPERAFNKAQRVLGFNDATISSEE